jgi:flagellar motor switch protein FliG
LAQGATKPVPSTHPLGDGAGTLRPPELRPPFDFLKETGDMKLSQMLMREHPQTIAVVMAHVPPNRAAGILPSFPPEMRKEVLRRMVESERADPLLVREIEQAVRSMLDASNRAEATSPEGLQAVTRILRSAGGSTYRTILDALSFPQRDNEPTEENEPTERIETGADTGAIQTVPKRTFDDVSRLSDAQLAAVLQAADEQTVELALMGASPSLIDRALSVLSHSRAAQQRQAMCPFRPTQLRDIEAAQQSLADLAAQLDSDSDSDADRSKRDVPHRFAATV